MNFFKDDEYSEIASKLFPKIKIEDSGRKRHTWFLLVSIYLFFGALALLLIFLLKALQISTNGLLMIANGYPDYLFNTQKPILSIVIFLTLGFLFLHNSRKE